MPEPVRTAEAPPPSTVVGPVAEVSREHGWEALEVEGTLPDGLEGTLYRNGPGHWARIHAEHWFDGVAGLIGVRLANGRAEGSVRLLQTRAARRAQRGQRDTLYAGRASVGSRIRGLLTGDAVGNLANINVQPWQDRLVALYEAAPPVEIDPDTLELKPGPVAPGVRTVNAHPHYVPSRRTTYHVGQVVGSRCALEVVAVPDEGPAEVLVSIPVPGIGEVHDFLATEQELVLVLPPLWARSLRVLLTGQFAPNLEWKASDGCEVVIVPLDAPTQFRRSRIPGFFWYHGVNAHRNGDAIEAMLVGYPDFGVEGWLDDLRKGLDHGPTQSQLWHLRIDDADQVTITEVAGTQGVEFPMVHPGYVSTRHRYAWMAGYADAPRGWWNELVRHDAESGDLARMTLGRPGALGEPVVVSRSNREDDVWLLSMVRDFNRDRSYVAVWDGTDPGSEPVARVWFPDPLPHTLHGCFLPSPGGHS